MATDRPQRQGEDGGEEKINRAAGQMRSYVQRCNMKTRVLMQYAITLMVIACMTPMVIAADKAGYNPGFPPQDKDKVEKVFPSRPVYSPYANRNFPTAPLFGDTHLHTSYSMDAGASGTRLDARAAYRFARGEQVTSNTGQPVKLVRPLDFLMVADHSVGFGFFPLLTPMWMKMPNEIGSKNALPKA